MIRSICSHDERDIRVGGHYLEIRPDEDNTQLADDSEVIEELHLENSKAKSKGSEVIEETNRKSSLENEVPRPPVSYT